eukprot:1264968-Prymnesium_polylepis.1
MTPRRSRQSDFAGAAHTLADWPRHPTSQAQVAWAFWQLASWPLTWRASPVPRALRPSASSPTPSGLRAATAGPRPLTRSPLHSPPRAPLRAAPPRSRPEHQRVSCGRVSARVLVLPPLLARAAAAAPSLAAWHRRAPLASWSLP